MLLGIFLRRILNSGQENARENLKTAPKNRKSEVLSFRSKITLRSTLQDLKPSCSYLDSHYSSSCSSTDPSNSPNCGNMGFAARVWSFGIPVQ